MKKKLILMFSMIAIAIFLFAISSSAVMVDGIDYSFKNGEATVTSENKNCQLEIVSIPETVTVTSEHTSDASLHGTYTVAYIANSAFRDNTVVKEVTTPSTIKDIYEHAFRSMAALTTVTLNASESFKCFRDAEFWGNKALVTVDMSGCKGFTSLGNGGSYDDTFDGCSNLERVVLPKHGVTYIGRHVFFNCNKLTVIENLDFSKVTYVGFKAFWGPKISGDVVLSENVTYVGAHAFRETNITSIVMKKGSDSATFSMDDATFYGCKQLKYAVLPNNLTKIGKYTFSGCSNLEYIVLGSGIQAFETTDTFSGCGTLKAIIYKDSEESFKAMSGISALGTVDYKPFSEYVHGTLPNGRTVYYGATTCNSCNGILGQESLKFTSPLESMKMSAVCTHCGAESVTVSYEPMFINLGYSAAEYGEGAMSINYKVNKDAISAYEEATGKSVSYGVFAVLADNIGDKELFDENGKTESGVIAADITNSGFTLFSLKIVGFTEEQKSIPLAMGAFVGTTKDGATEYSYLQIEKPSSGKYFFASYNDVLAILESKENEVA